VDTDERAYLEALLSIHRKRLQVLELEAARKGVDTPPHVHVEIEEIQQKLVGITKLLANSPPLGNVAIDLFSFPVMGANDSSHICLDWVNFFNPSLPTVDIWNTILVPNLNNLLHRLIQNNSRVIVLRAKAHLSVGYAFGYAFREPTGFKIWIEQHLPNAQQMQWWRTDQSATLETPLSMMREEFNPRGESMTVEISVAWNIHNGVKRCIERNDLSIRERLKFVSSSIPSDVKDSNVAQTIAMQVREAIMSVRTANPHHTIHLFGAIPFALAVLIGAKLNACGPIQCYDYDTKTREYQPSCLLE
jgi:hypothetical protein